MDLQQDTVARFLRGAAGSSLVHGGLLMLALLPVSESSNRAGSAGPSPVALPVTALPSPARRDPDLPFRSEPAGAPRGALPLSIDNGPGGADFTIDLARIRERRNDLFPFVTWDLRFLRERPGHEPGGSLQFPDDLGPLAPVGGATLALAPGQLQAIVDRAWSRRHRWTNLQELTALAERYNADAGDLPVLFREYVEQNIPQPYEDWSDPDPVYWITLMLAADDAPLVEFVGRYARRHPASRLTTELLFLLDASAESSCDVLRRVLRVGTPELPLVVTQFDNPEAYDLAASLASAYRSWVVRHRANVPERCTGARIAMLRRIIDTSPGGYGVSDARFRLGQLLWNAERYAEAVDWWRGMQPDGRSQYARAQRALLGALADGAAEFAPHRISSILLDEERRWRVAADSRLEHFGVLATEF